MRVQCVQCVCNACNACAMCATCAVCNVCSVQRALKRPQATHAGCAGQTVTLVSFLPRYCRVGCGFDRGTNTWAVCLLSKGEPRDVRPGPEEARAGSP
eukprot:2490646-Rhodomonas_salina.1